LGIGRNRGRRKDWTGGRDTNIKGQMREATEEAQPDLGEGRIWVRYTTSGGEGESPHGRKSRGEKSCLVDEEGINDGKLKKKKGGV